jgi:hypothetical protein
MDVQQHNICINVPSSKTFRSCLFLCSIFYVGFLFTIHGVNFVRTSSPPGGLYVHTLSNAVKPNIFISAIFDFVLINKM